MKKPLVLARLAELDADKAAAVVARPVVAASAARDLADVDPVTAIVASVAGLAPGSFAPTARFSSDLNLDSLRRVEMLGVIEEDMGVFVDDDALDPDATVADLIALVEAARDAKRRPGAWSWPLSPAVRAFGLAFQILLMYPFVKLCYRVKTTGLENLRGLEGPLLFLPNHCLHLDNAIILSRLPFAVRWRLTVAAAADTMYDNRVQGVLVSMLANAFPLQREGGVRKSLEILGQRLDRGFHVMLFPEGRLTLGGPLQPFKAGAGMIAVEGYLPVVPMRLRITNMSLLDHRRWRGPFRGEVEVVFGKPITFDADMDHAAATTRLEAAVAEL